MINYKLNLQTTFSHQNFGYLDQDVKVLMKIYKEEDYKDNNNLIKENIFEIEEKKLDEIIQILKEVYLKIRI
jgi:hypothetical protein